MGEALPWTAGPWRVAGKNSGYVFSDGDPVVVAIVGNYPDRELRPFNLDRWNADARLVAAAPAMAAIIRRLASSGDPEALAVWRSIAPGVSPDPQPGTLKETRE